MLLPTVVALLLAAQCADGALARLTAQNQAWEALRARGTRTWQLRSEVEKRDSAGAVNERESELLHVVRVEGRAFYRRLVHNGLPPTDA